MFRKIKSQESVLTLLSEAIKKDKIAQSYLFYGPDGVGKFTTALYFGMALNCTSDDKEKPCANCNSCKKFLSFSHPDFTYIFPSSKLNISVNGEIKSEKALKEYNEYIENKKKTPWRKYFFSQNAEIRVGSIRMLEHKINLSPNEAKFKIYIVEDADQMNEESANAFLKTLEEPPVDSVIILTTSKPNSLLPTIISRCQQIRFMSIPRDVIEQKLKEEKDMPKIERKMYARISNGNLEKALRLAEEGSITSREKTLQFLEIFLKNDDMKFIEFAENFRATNTKSLLYEMINQLIIWFGDLSFYKNSTEQIVNLDKTDLLEQFFMLNSDVNFYVPAIIEFLEDMQRRIKGNINRILIFYQIYFKMKDIFQK